MKTATKALICVCLAVAVIAVGFASYVNQNTSKVSPTPTLASPRPSPKPTGTPTPTPTPSPLPRPTPIPTPTGTPTPVPSPTPLPTTPPAGSYQLEGFSLNIPVQFYINLNGAPPGAFQAIQNAMNTWNTAVGKQIFLPLLVNNSSTCGYDGRDSISWGCAQNALAITSIYPANGKEVDTDITFNSTLLWGINPTTPHTFDVQDIATHELGHAVGLNDIRSSSFNYVTMYYSANYDETSKDVLSWPDIYGAELIYGVVAS